MSNLSYAEGNWFEGDIKTTCSQMKSNKRCESCADGWTYTAFLDKTKNNAVFAEYSHRSCGFFLSFSCGDSFKIENKKMSCEDFVTKLKEKNSSCHQCLYLEEDAGG